MAALCRGAGGRGGTLVSESHGFSYSFHVICFSFSKWDGQKPLNWCLDSYKGNPPMFHFESLSSWVKGGSEAPYSTTLPRPLSDSDTINE